MSNNTKRGLDATQFQEMIAEVSASDRQRAREAIAGGIHAAQSQWIEAPLIAQALALELIAFVNNNSSNLEMANHLKALAAELEAQGELH